MPTSHLPQQQIAYAPYGSTDVQYDEVQNARAKAIFAALNLSDPMTADGQRKWGVRQPTLTEPFRFVPSKFLQWAQANPPRNPVATASGFADWVFSLYNSPSSSSADSMALGIAMERIIFEQRSRYEDAMDLVSGTDNIMLGMLGLPWRLVHCGLHLDPEKETVSFLKLEDLCVHGEPLRVSPDLVYSNKHNGEVVVVEVKFTRSAISANLWPNVWAQLWVYAHIPLACAATKVTVVGEIWGEWFAPNERLRVVGLRASVRRDPRTRPYDRFFRALFNIYRSEFD